jgi:hypothetical protein
MALDNEKEILNEKEVSKKDNGTTGVICFLPKELESLIRIIKFKHSINNKGDAIVIILKEFLETTEGKELIRIHDTITVGVPGNDDGTK